MGGLGRHDDDPVGVRHRDDEVRARAGDRRDAALRLGAGTHELHPIGDGVEVDGEPSRLGRAGGQPRDLAQHGGEEELEREHSTDTPSTRAVAWGPPGCSASDPTHAPNGSSTSRTTSNSPCEMPPAVTMTSAVATARASTRAKSSGSSLVRSCSTTSHPAARAAAASAGPLASKICPGASAAPGGASSAPVLMTAIRMRRATSTRL